MRMDNKWLMAELDKARNNSAGLNVGLTAAAAAIALVKSIAAQMTEKERRDYFVGLVAGVCLIARREGGPEEMRRQRDLMNDLEKLR